MTDLFDSPRRMIRWGKQHIDNLEGQIKAFGAEKPWAMVVEKDPDGSANVHKIKFSEQLSEFLPNIIFDAANNLRSALDQAAFQIAVRHTGRKKPKSAKFPIAPTEADVVNNANGGCKDVPTEVRDLFVSFKSYKGGNNALWALNELCNVPKHQMIYPVGMGGGSTVMRPNGFVSFPGEPLEIHAPRWDRDKYELVFARLPIDGQFTGDFDVSFTVAFDDVDEVIRGQEPVGVLRVMASEVENALDLTETMCRCIGMIK